MLAIYQRELPFEEWAADFLIESEQERATLRQEYAATRACTTGGNEIFSLRFPRLESSI